MQFLKQSTTPTVQIGPFLDDTDGKTPETGLTISRADVLLSKNGGAYTQKTEVTSCTADGSNNGWYTCPLDATDTGTLGILILAVNKSGALPIWHEYMAVPENVWDSLFGADNLKVDVTQIAGAAVATGTAQLGVNVVKLGTSTIQQAGGYIKVSAGTTAGEIELTSGKVTVNNVDDCKASGYAVAGDIMKVDEGIGANQIKLTAGRVTVDNVDDCKATGYAVPGADGDTLKTISDQIDGITTIGSGATLYTLTITDGSNPLDGVEVWITSDSAGNSVVAGTLVTGSGSFNNGQVEFWLDPGTYYAWAQLAGYNFSNPDTITVT